jgi:hypothetical protein
MKNIASKWPFVLIIIPFLSDYFLGLIKSPKLDLSAKIIGGLSITVLALAWELYKSNKKSITPRDKRIINELLTTLNVDLFEEAILNQNAWNGYRQDAIGNLIDFKCDSQKISNQVLDKELNTLLKTFTHSLIEFNNHSSKYLFGDHSGNYYKLHRTRESDRERCEKEAKIINQFVPKMDVEFKKMMTYLNKKKYLN